MNDERLCEKKPPMIEPFVVPHFDNETDEANWWYDHRADIERLFDQHAAAGTLRWTDLADFKRRTTAAAPPHDTLT